MKNSKKFSKFLKNLNKLKKMIKEKILKIAMTQVVHCKSNI